MSWSIKAIGERFAVKLEVQKNPTMPQGIKDAVSEILDDAPPGDTPDGARVEGYGHTEGGFGSIGKLEVEIFKLVKIQPVKSSV